MLSTSLNSTAMVKSEVATMEESSMDRKRPRATLWGKFVRGALLVGWYPSIGVRPTLCIRGHIVVGGDLGLGGLSRRRAG
jgi:hypothetical protein